MFTPRRLLVVGLMGLTLSAPAALFAGPCLGDANTDGEVNAADLALLLGSWGACAGCDTDLNGDDQVNAADLALLLGNWGSCESVGLACCNPNNRPGAHGNPPCIEGTTCCSDGTWQCNEPGTDPCTPGVVCPCCDPADAPGAGENPPCFEGASCCANGQWACNLGDGSPSCNTLGEVCGQVCGGILGIPCRDGQFCNLNIGECCCDFQGHCAVIPEVCEEIFDPVCGCDGVTYSNACFAAAAAVSVAHPGSCR